MCYQPINICVKSKVLDYELSQPLYTYVPCGHCIECNHRKRDEMRFRTYYESLRTIQNGGYILSQCLTYAPEFRPYLRDFMSCDSPVNDCSCFNRAHIRKFFMNLRNFIRRDLGIDISNKLKYLLCSEYGTSEFGQHAPHYHCLFFVTEPSLSWQLLSHAIEVSWPFGLTDSVDRYPHTYFVNCLKPHLFNSDNFDIHTFSIAINYVTEYLTKDCVYQDTLNSRFFAFYDTLCESIGSDSAREIARKIKRNVNQFRLNSHHFGDNFLDYNTSDDVYKDGVVRMPGTKASLPSLTIPLPLYYERSLFYKLVRDFDGSLKWLKKQDFATHCYLKSKVLRQLNTFALSYETIYTNSSSSFKVLIDKLLDNRSFNEFVAYLVCFRGRFITMPSIDYDLQIDNIIRTPFYKNLHVAFLDYTDCRPYVTYCNTFTYNVEEFAFLAKNCYNQNSHFEFRYFDDLFYLFTKMQAMQILPKKSADALIQSIQKSLKLLRK